MADYNSDDKGFPNAEVIPFAVSPANAIKGVIDYRTSQGAKLWQISPHVVDSLCCTCTEICNRKYDDWMGMQCCTKAVKDLNGLHCKQATNGKTVLRWHMDFCDGSLFRDPSHLYREGKIQLPPFSEHFPDAKDSFCVYANTNLPPLSAEVVLEYAMDTVFPALMKEDNPFLKTPVNEEEKTVILQKPGYLNLCLFTMIRWIHILFGYLYDVRKKHYYKAKHEDPQNIEYRSAFIE